ncbi:hypothetical protein LCGC14_2728400, partial [marine sediment metagenome]
MRLKGKVAIITGGGSGIGRATSKLFSREGAKVIVNDYKEESGLGTVREIKESGGDAIFIEADISSPDQVKSLVDAALETYGGIDILFNNAGVLYFGTILDTDMETW